jgi:hypothetical protein
VERVQRVEGADRAVGKERYEHDGDDQERERRRSVLDGDAAHQRVEHRLRGQRDAATTATASTTNALRVNGATTPASDTTPSRNETRKAASDVSPRGRSRRTSPA